MGIYEGSKGKILLGFLCDGVRGDKNQIENQLIGLREH